MEERISQKVEDKMGRLLDERIQSLIIPSVINQLVQKLTGNKRASKVKHQVKCSGCGVEPIVGVRYKCVECQGLSLC
jgi:hypothetical protein